MIWIKPARPCGGAPRGPLPHLEKWPENGFTHGCIERRPDRLGYEAMPARRDGEWQIEAFNCVFHDMARRHPEVCRFDLAFLEAAGGREVRHMECIVRGGACCRFRLGPRRP